MQWKRFNLQLKPKFFRHREQPKTFFFLQRAEKTADRLPTNICQASGTNASNHTFGIASYSKKKITKKNIRKTKTSNLTKLLYTCLLYMGCCCYCHHCHCLQCLLFRRYFCCCCCCCCCRFVFTSLHFMYVSFGNSWTNYYYCWMKWCWFRLQFLHRLQRSTKFQCEINKEKTATTTTTSSTHTIFVYLHFKNTVQQTLNVPQTVGWLESSKARNIFSSATCKI